MMLAFAHASFEASKWGVRSDDNIKVIMSPQAGVHTARILSRKDAIKAAAHKRVDRKGLHHLVTRVRNQCIRMGVFPNS